MMGTKWLAGTLLGLPLAFALCTLGIVWLPGGWQSGLVAALLLCLPAWVAIISLSLLFRTSLAAWLWLAGANLAGFGLTWGLHAMHAIPAVPPVM